MSKVRKSLPLAAQALSLTVLMVALPADADTVFWLSPRSNVQLDQQVAAAIAPDAKMIILRTSWEFPESDYTTAAIVQRLKREGSGPVLAYSWVNRYAQSGRSEGDMFKGLDIGKPLVVLEETNEGKTSLLDVTDPALRKRIVQRFASARSSLGVDGFAVDLSTRTPVRGPLSRRCSSEVAFCKGYAQGMDELYADIRKALGPNATLAYNGLFNFVPGQIADQAKLLEHSDAAAIEYFGMDPNEKEHSFTKDILPFVKAARDIPRDKAILFFGRGPWRYTNYVEDYRWQRYLFASFLLASRPKDLFKFHASFQVPAHQGRAGGLDRYADWKLSLGGARGEALPTPGGLWKREFEAGVVFVAPDDGRGGKASWNGAMFTPEGEALREQVDLKPGTGLVLLRRAPTVMVRADKVVIDAETMAGWKWSGTSLANEPGQGKVLRIDRSDPKLVGEHDVMLDGERSLTPYRRLELDARLADKSASILVVAEVDDANRREMNLVFEVKPSASGPTRMGDPILFRASSPKKEIDPVPYVPVALRVDGHPTVLEGPQLLEGTPYHFRRWSHLRLDDGVNVRRITLSRPREPLPMAPVTKDD
jgi:hypothetical protein